MSDYYIKPASGAVACDAEFEAQPFAEATVHINTQAVYQEPGLLVRVEVARPVNDHPLRGVPVGEYASGLLLLVRPLTRQLARRAYKSVVDGTSQTLKSPIGGACSSSSRRRFLNASRSWLPVFKRSVRFLGAYL